MKLHIGTCPKRGKLQFQDKAHALAAVMEMKERGRDVRRLGPFQCCDCGWWHLGNKHNRGRKRHRR